jgi:hypothetical protein
MSDNLALKNNSLVIYKNWVGSDLTAFLLWKFFAEICLQRFEQLPTVNSCRFGQSEKGNIFGTKKR